MVPSDSAGHDDRGVSEMVAVVTLVAVAFILVAGVGISAFVFSADDAGPPQANFSYNYLDQASALLITYEQGDQLWSGDVYVSGSDNNATWTALAGANESIAVTPGDAVQIGEAGAYGAPIRSSSRIEIVWRNTTLNESAVISRWSGGSGI